MNITSEFCPICQIEVESSEKQPFCPKCDRLLPTLGQQVMSQEWLLDDYTKKFQDLSTRHTDFRWRVARALGVEKGASDEAIFSKIQELTEDQKPDPWRKNEQV